MVATLIKAKPIWRGFLDMHKYRGKWDMGWLVASVAMEAGIALIVTGIIFLVVGFDPTGGAYLGLWFLIGGIFAFVLSCFEIFENYPHIPDEEELKRMRFQEEDYIERIKKYGK